MVKSLSSRNFVWLLALAAACWGLGTVMTKHALGAMPPLTLPVVQLAASSAFLWAIVLARGQRPAFDRRTARLALTGLLEPGLATTFAVLGLKLTTASMTSLIFAAQPALVVLLAGWLLGERLTRPLLVLALLAALGVGLVAGTDVSAGGIGSSLGNLLVMASLLFCSLYLVWSRRWVAGVNPVVLVALQQTVGLAWTLAVWPVELAQGGFASLAHLGPGVWLWAASSGIVYYALGFCFYLAGLKRAPASLAALFLSLTPVFGLAGATLFLGERLQPAQWLGAAVILAAVLAIARAPAEEPQPVNTQTLISDGFVA
jgi:drug/metabolite transporter (DMT)-like permease